MIDWTRVEELQRDIGNAAFAQVTELFLEEAETVLAGLHPALPAEDMISQLHFLKGSALNMGFSRLADLCGLGERLAAAGEPAAVPLARIARSFHDSREMFLGPGAPRALAI